MSKMSNLDLLLKEIDEHASALIEATKDLRAMSIDELEAKLVECKKEQFNLRIQKSTGQLQNTAQLAKVRKEVAKINTLISERKKN